MKASGGEVSPLVVSPQNSARPTWENSTLRQKKKASSPTCLAAVQSSCDFHARKRESGWDRKHTVRVLFAWALL